MILTLIFKVERIQVNLYKIDREKVLILALREKERITYNYSIQYIPKKRKYVRWTFNKRGPLLG